MSGENAGIRLNEMLAAQGLPELRPETTDRFKAYLALLMRWNARLNLTAIRDEDGILSRHFLESIACARTIPAGAGTLLDFGSGAGFPGIPIALCRPEIAVTLAESQTKKAAFLQEALRILGLASAKVHAGRGEALRYTFDCVVMRAVDRMERAAGVAGRLVSPGGWLILMATNPELNGLETAAGDGGEFQWRAPVGLPLSQDRVIAVGTRTH
jgi:16S rRNA (guanine527-N7)-methyltransferase